MKKVCMVLILLMLMGCSNDNVDLSDGEKFEEEYEELNGKEGYGENVYQTLDVDSDNPFVYKGYMDVIEMINEKQDFVVYFGFASCPWCRSVVSTMIDVAKDLGIKEIYYIDIEGGRDVLKLDEEGNVVTETEPSVEYEMLLNELDALLGEYILTDAAGNEVSTGKKRLYAPSIVSFVDGKPIKLVDGISELQTDAYMELTDEMLNQSYEEIKEVMKFVSDAEKVCSDGKKC